MLCALGALGGLAGVAAESVCRHHRAPYAAEESEAAQRALIAATHTVVTPDPLGTASTAAGSQGALAEALASPDLPATVAAGGGSAIGDEGEGAKRTVVGHVVQAEPEPVQLAHRIPARMMGNMFLSLSVPQ